MDPVSAGASVVTFITLAFSVTKTIHNVLSSIKDGPQVVQYLKDEVAQLQSILGRISEISHDSTHGNDATELGGLVQKCVNDMTSFDSKLRRLDISGADGRSGRLWRRLKNCFTERDLEQMRQVVRGHVQLLTVRLTLVQTQQLSLSTTQSAEILSLLQQLKHDVAALQINHSSDEDRPEVPASQVMEVDEMDAMPSTDSTLAESITRLLKLVEKKSCVIESDDAEQLVDDLENLLKSIQKDAAMKASIEKATNTSQCSCSQSEDVSKELRLVSSLFLSAPSIKINQNGPMRFLADIPQGMVIHHERKRKMIEIADGIVTLTASKRRRRLLEPDDTNNKDSHGREFVSTLVFKPKNTNSMLTLSVNQGQVLFDSFTSMLPRITVSNILPTDSLVFKLAADGNVQDLIQLVSSGKASWHDHDTNGQSLLHHAVLNSHVSLSSFLIEQGLDVNEIAKYDSTSIEITALHLAKSQPAMAQILLASGADPTIDSIEILRQACESPFVRYSDLETLASDNAFVKACRPSEGYPIDGIKKLDPQQNIKKLAFLLDRGFTVLDRDDQDNTCLLRVFDPELRHYPYFELWKEVLVYLIQNGADIHATKNWGDTVSSFAYGQGLGMPRRDSDSSFPGDLWDAVLDSCGYNIYKFRKHCPRRPFYTGTYTRQAFESLWQGKEHRCPYWNDEVWPDEDSCGILTNSDVENCTTCFECFAADGRGSKSLCGGCGYCLTVLDCECFDRFVKEPGPTCQHPRQGKVVWDEDDGRYILDQAAGGTANDEQESSDEQTSDSGQVSDAESANEERRTTDTSSCGQQPPATYAQPHIGWTTGLPLWQHRIEPPVYSQGYATNDSPSHRELFLNPWQEDQPPKTTATRGRPWCI
ncbi:hypothetical protein NM208_g4949 [Fusarium decemcellulare]|uniref:Uncharacterized protein n=1 Tax=Fusarium decemcellulare TaxID=57161 RepID=A0ACC1SIU8_9HYPO|nr:hypothetical protein NM208_g4949 [Fusarium decemcellulare]